MLRQKTGVQRWVPLLLVCTLAGGGCSALSNGVSSTPVALKELSLHELMNIEVTSVSRTPTRRFETAAAIQVITHDDIHRSGATTLAEALRLVPNLQIAQSNSHDWAITARGFNAANVSTGSVANKLLVMIDGRSIYTPLFGGVFWDAQQVSLDDIDRIEVVSGPGGTLWGANAVNGVINIITRSAEETQGGNATVAVGSLLEKFGAARYGGRIGNDFSYRVYGQRFDADSVQRSNGTDGNDDWNLTQAGVRTDSRISEADSLTVQGDFYEGGEGSPGTAFINGQNAIARWTHTTSPDSDWIAQIYFDRTKRTFPTASFREELQTVDIDVQHRFPVGTLHTILWGAGYRHMWDDVKNGPGFSFLPGKRTMQLASAFVQDEVTVRNARVTFGTKFEHNEFSGLEAQPSVRVAWTPSARQMAWTAVSRAIRSPARFDTEIKSGATFGNPDFAAEKVMAYELGYRISPSESMALSLSLFRNQYTDLRSINLGAQPGTLVFDNDLDATTFGVELSGGFQPASWWRLRGGYTHLEKNLRLESPLALTFSDPFEAQDPQNQMLLQSVMDLPRGMQFDVVARHVAELPVSLVGPRIPAYTTADVRLAWRVARWEFAAIGKNLGGSHPEFNSPVLWYEIPRSVQGRLSFAW